ncbi:MAG TPA: metallophosphoesterase family protein [Burkholderiales bacterium]|nr:metallophosphoesterase family protein [Burkholderiales bacterium]
MALYGIIADIHGNREALEAVLRALDNRVDEIVCLGDIVGYNADPDECAATLRRRGVASIAGNHDLIAIGRLDTSRCANNARYALERTRQRLGVETAAYLAELPPHRLIGAEVVLVHGGVRDVQQYLRTPALIRENAAYLREDFPGAKLCFFGHSHEQRVFAVEDVAIREVARDESVYLVKDRVYFINPGSVDAARRRANKLAECAILDTEEWRVEFLRVPYDAAAAEAKAAAFGYRIDPWTDRLYSLQRKIASKFKQIRAA